jgi:hypothetical protein
MKLVRVGSGQRLHAIFNLKAFMPLWRPSNSSAVCSRLTSSPPQVFRPQLHAEVVYTARRECMMGKELASIVFPYFLVRPLVQKEGYICNFLFLVVLYVKCMSSAVKEKVSHECGCNKILPTTVRHEEAEPRNLVVYLHP